MLQIVRLIHTGDPLAYGLVFIGVTLLILAISYREKSHAERLC